MNSAGGGLLVVDTSVWIDYLEGRDRPHTAQLDRIVDQQRIAVGDLVLAEVLQGCRSAAEFNLAHRELRRFEIIELGGEVNAIRAARCYRTLRSKGITVRGLIDCLIAAAVIAGDHLLLHNDRDFDHFEQHLGLQVLHPS